MKKTATELVEEADLEKSGLEPSLRQALGAYATGVAIVTTVDQDCQPVGITVNSFASLSLAPPLILWSLNAESPSRTSFDRASHFAVNVLSEAQVALSRRFASRTPNKFAGLAMREGLGGTPLIEHCAAVFECRLQTRHPGGDHVLYIGEVDRFEAHADRAPLLFHLGHYRQIGSPLA